MTSQDLRFVIFRLYEFLLFLGIIIFVAGVPICLAFIGVQSSIAGILLVFVALPIVAIASVFFLIYCDCKCEEVIPKPELVILFIVGFAFIYVVSPILMFLGGTVYLMETQGVPTVTDQTNVSSLTGRVAIQFDSSFSLHFEYLFEYGVECETVESQISVCWTCVIPIISSRTPNFTHYWAVCDYSGMFSCSKYLAEQKDAELVFPVCIEKLMKESPYGKGGFQLYVDSFSIVSKLAEQAEQNFSLIPSSQKIFLNWEDIWATYDYCLKVSFSIFIAFNGLFVLWIVTRRIFCLFCCRVDPCTLEDIED